MSYAEAFIVEHDVRVSVLATSIGDYEYCHHQSGAVLCVRSVGGVSYPFAHLLSGRTKPPTLVATVGVERTCTNNCKGKY